MSVTHDGRRMSMILARWAIVLASCLVLADCGSTPQLGGDQECLGAADALWTAIGAQRSDLVDAAAEKLERLHSAGKMPDDAFEDISEIVAQARAGEWSDARAALKTFVQGQRPANSS